MPYTYAQAQRLRLRVYFEVAYRGLRGPTDPMCVRALIVQRNDRLWPRSPRGLFCDCPPPAPAEAKDALYEVVLLSTPCHPNHPGNPTRDLCRITLAAHCQAHATPLEIPAAGRSRA